MGRSGDGMGSGGVGGGEIVVAGWRMCWRAGVVVGELGVGEKVVRV